MSGPHGSQFAAACAEFRASYPQLTDLDVVFFAFRVLQRVSLAQAAHPGERVSERLAAEVSANIEPGFVSDQLSDLARVGILPGDGAVAPALPECCRAFRERYLRWQDLDLLPATQEYAGRARTQDVLSRAAWEASWREFASSRACALAEAEFATLNRFGGMRGSLQGAARDAVRRATGAPPTRDQLDEVWERLADQRTGAGDDVLLFKGTDGSLHLDWRKVRDLARKTLARPTVQLCEDTPARDEDHRLQREVLEELQRLRDELRDPADLAALAYLRSHPRQSRAEVASSHGVSVKQLRTHETRVTQMLKRRLAT